MERYLSSMVDAHERYSEAFIALVEEYNTLGEHISSLGDANQSSNDALTAVLAQSNAASDHCFNDLTILNLHEQHKHFILACENLRDYIDSRSQQVRELAVALHTNAAETAPVVSPDNAQPRDRLVLSSQGQGDMESDFGHGDEADMSEEHKMAVSQALADLDLNKPAPDEIVKNDMAAQEETVDDKMAATQVP